VQKSNLFAFIVSGAVLAACADGGGTNPFKDNETDTDTDSNQITINNLPFDGAEPTPYFLDSDIELAWVADAGSNQPNGAAFRNARVYRNFENPDEFLDRYFAILIRSDNMQVGSTATPEYADFGYGGALVERLTADVTMPNDGQIYNYAGVYAGQRVFSNRGGLELVQGNARLQLDLADFDFTGAVRGNITERVRRRPDGGLGAVLPDLQLVIEGDGSDGDFEGGTALTKFTPFDGGTQDRDTGSFSGTFGGPNGEELGGFVIIEGVAEIRNVSYDVATYNDGRPVSSLSDAQRASIITALGNGVDPPSYTIDPNSDPAIVSVTSVTEVFQTDFNARETGIFLTNRD